MPTDTSSQIAINSEDGQHITLVLRGDLTIYQAEQLCEAAVALLQHEADVVMSCHELVQLDTAALQVLLVLQRELQSRGRHLRLEGLSVELREWLELAAVADKLIGQSTTHTA
jgi:anti-anti-sigma factor